MDEDWMYLSQDFLMFAKFFSAKIGSISLIYPMYINGA